MLQVSIKKSFMKKKSFLLWSLLLVGLSMTACSDKNEVPGTEDGEKSSFTIKLALQNSNTNTRAPQSTAIPATSWSNIHQVQLFLYDAANTVRFSDVITPSATQSTFTYTDVPVGTYTVVLVANAKSSTDPVVTSLDNGATAAEWTKWTVRQKLATGMLIKQKTGTFPAFLGSALAAKTAYVEPSEVFMGEATGVTITANTTTTVPAITLKREVSLMRLRLNVKDGDGVVNENVDKGVDFAQDASILLHRLPDNMKILAGNAGGVSATSSTDNILSISGADVFKTADPTTGYAPTTILGGNFTMWRDIVVFPNNGGRANNSATTGLATAAQQYFIVVSGKGKVGHILANGTALTAETTVYWSGVVKENFIPNVIREVNLTLQTGGTTEVPVNPTEYGGLTITVSAPAPWDSNIVDSNIIL